MLHLAFRNVLRNKRRTWLTFFLVISGTFFLSVMQFIANGFMDEMVKRAVKLDSGLVEVAAYGWKERPGLYRSIEADGNFLSSLAELTGRSVSPRIKSGALLSYENKTRFVSVLAADPEAERKITTLHNYLTDGRWPHRDSADEAAVGDRLARALGLIPGSRIFLIGSQLDGSLGAVPLTITGIYRTGTPNLDASRVFIPLVSGKLLFGNELEDKSYYTSIAFETADFLDAKKIREILLNKFPVPSDPDGLPPAESSVFDPVVLSWQDLNPAVVEMTAMGYQKMNIYLVFFVISISFGVLNTVQMSVQERMREFGILLAVGTGIRRLTLMIFYEIIILIVPPVAAGVLLSASVAGIISLYPIDLAGTTLGNVYTSMGMSTTFRPVVTLGHAVNIASSMIIPSVLTGMIAAGRIRKLNPIRIIQTL